MTDDVAQQVMPAMNKLEVVFDELCDRIKQLEGPNGARRLDLIEEVKRMREAGHDPANLVRCRLFEICEELLGIKVPEETHEQWKQRMRESYNLLTMGRVRRA